MVSSSKTITTTAKTASKPSCRRGCCWAILT
jgi:hypothetical protein